MGICRGRSEEDGRIDRERSGNKGGLPHVSCDTARDDATEED